MFFRRRSKNSEERIQDLRARVESLRQLDEAGESRHTLEDFLEGDDVVTGRTPQGAVRTPPHRSAPNEGTEAPRQVDSDGVDLAAELEKYLAREAERTSGPAAPEESEDTPAEATEGTSWESWPAQDPARRPPPRQDF